MPGGAWRPLSGRRLPCKGPGGQAPGGAWRPLKTFSKNLGRPCRFLEALKPPPEAPRSSRASRVSKNFQGPAGI